MDRIQAVHALGLTEPCTRDDVEATYRHRIARLQPYLRDPVARESAVKLESQYNEAWRTLSASSPSAAPLLPVGAVAGPVAAHGAPPTPPPVPAPLPPPSPDRGPASDSGPPDGPVRRTIRRIVGAIVVVVIGLAVVITIQDLQPDSASNSCLNERDNGELFTVGCSSKKADFKVRRQVDRPSECSGPDYMEKQMLFFFKQTYCLTPIKK